MKTSSINFLFITDMIEGCLNDEKGSKYKREKES